MSIDLSSSTQASDTYHAPLGTQLLAWDGDGQVEITMRFDVLALFPDVFSGLLVLTGAFAMSFSRMISPPVISSSMAVRCRPWS